MVGSFLAALGARDQLLVARLGERLGRSFALLAVGLATSVVAALAAAWAGAWLSARMSETAATMFVAMALAVAALELAWPMKREALNDPTRSLGAITVVLLARQITDGARFLVCAIAAATASPTLAGIGGAIGGGAAVALGWAMRGALEARLPLKALRLGLAAALLLLAVLTGLFARGTIG